MQNDPPTSHDIHVAVLFWRTPFLHVHASVLRGGSFLQFGGGSFFTIQQEGDFFCNSGDHLRDEIQPISFSVRTRCVLFFI